MPFLFQNVRIPLLEFQANYFADRKFLLVNGGHTTLAFLTMLDAKERGIAFDPPGTIVHAHTNTHKNKRCAYAYSDQMHTYVHGYTSQFFCFAGDLQLLHWDLLNPESQLAMWAFTVARLLLISWQFDTEVLKVTDTLHHQKFRPSTRMRMACKQRVNLPTSC